MAAASTLKHLGIPLPAWFPVPKGSAMPIGMTLFLWIFLTPFIALGLGMFLLVCSSIAGRTEIGIQGSRGVLFCGVGPLGFRKRFSVSEIRDVRIEDTPWRDRNGAARHNAKIVIDTNPKPISFGSMLTEERRQFMAGALTKLVHPSAFS